MSEHRAALAWHRTTSDFAYDTYSRDHQVTFGEGVELTASAAPEFKGRATLPNPEELLVAALSSCHLLSLLAIAARKRLVVDDYRDLAVGTLSKNAAGRLFVSRVVLRPRVRFAAPVDAQTLAALHRQAHEECFIANSVLTQVDVEPVSE